MGGPATKNQVGIFTEADKSEREGRRGEGRRGDSHKILPL